MFLPKIFSIIKEGKLDKQQFLKDVIAGLVVAIIALPLSVALAIASGVSPEKGIITAIIAGFIISLLGGSAVQIGGPTGAFVVIICGIIEKYGVQGLTIATIMAGVLLVVFGLFKMGNLIKYIPYTITVGFTAGIAVVLFSTQVKDFLGLNITSVPSNFIPKWQCYFTNLNTANHYSILIGLLCLIIITLWPKVNKTIPGSLIALIISTVIVSIFNMPVETIGSRFGQISSNISVINLNGINIDTMKGLIQPAITIAILAGIESLLSAVVADGMVGDKHNSNTELIAQGLANVGSALFGGIPATGAIARTAANIKNGGRSPIAGMVHALTLLLIMIILMPYAKLIPMASLSAILIVVSYNMSGWRTVKDLLKAPKEDVAVLLITFILTVVFDLVIAIEIGMVLSMIVFIKEMCKNTIINKLESHEYSHMHTDSKITDNVLLCEIKGPLFFGVTHNFREIVNKIDEKTKIVILNMKQVPTMDATAFNAIKNIHAHCKNKNIKLIFSELQEQPKKVFEKMSSLKNEDKKIFSSLNEALIAAGEFLK